MSKTAGIKPFTTDENFVEEIKQALLLFDVVGIEHLLGILKPEEVNPRYIDLFNKLQPFADQGLLFNATTHKTGKSPLPRGVQKEVYSRDEFKIIKQIIKTKPVDVELFMETCARISALWFNVERNTDFYYIPIIKRLTIPKEITTTKTDVIKVLIEHVPVPDQTTPWEAILDFKNDEDNKGRMGALRKWVNGAVKSNLTPGEISDEIDYLMYRYKKSLEIHKIKYQSGVLQSVIVGSAELAENVLKLRFSKIAKGLFSFHQAKADLMSEELTAPGHELAYIYQTQQNFQGKK